MSTAGKVLVVLIMLVAIGCLILAGGVGQLNYNANQKLQQLTVEVEKTQKDLEETRLDIMKYRDETSVTQEKIDREVAALLSQQTDLERTRSQITDMLNRAQYDLSVVKGTIADAQDSLQARITELDAETKAMADLRRNVQLLKERNAQSMNRLESLRKQFQKTHQANVEMLGKPR